MEWVDRLNRMIEYIESHLDGVIDEQELAQITAMPLGRLQRMMPVIANTSLAEYIRHRRLSRAAMDLRMTDSRVIDIAIKYGYDSPAAFAVAFKRQHNAAPSAVRSGSVRIASYPRLTFAIKVRGGDEMNTRIVEREGFRVVGKAIEVRQDNKECITNFWDAANSDGTERRLLPLGKPPFLGVCYGMNAGGGFRYMIGLESTLDALPDDLEAVNIPPSTWAVFDCTGPMPNAMHSVWERVFTEFLPNEPYAHAGTPDLEVYDAGDVAAEDYHSEIWIPIVKK
ncbi:MAG: AraC family transcriptional regulator [Oscillospiraceae bacterium]|jgi:AraC family transcriptional regulator|nr:AraC family transcriptional regulator [Oscillospiraceae bacterium]